MSWQAQHFAALLIIADVSSHLLFTSKPRRLAPEDTRSLTQSLRHPIAQWCPLILSIQFGDFAGSRTGYREEVAAVRTSMNPLWTLIISYVDIRKASVLCFTPIELTLTGVWQ